MGTVFANGRSIVHSGDGQVNIAAAPDVCKTPSPSGPIPVPYPNIAQDSDLSDGSSEVKVEGKSAALDGSSLSTSSGDEAGSAGGIISSKIKGKMTWIGCSPDVKFEGKGVVRFLDVCMHNGASPNTGGQPQLGMPTPPAVEAAAAAAATPDPVIVAVRILEGGAVLAGGPVRQWVNLSKDAKWVDRSVTSVDRTSPKLRFRIVFNRPGAHGFKVKLEPHASNAAYTGAEKGRNANFEFTQGEKSSQTDGSGSKVVEGVLKVSAAGWDRFRIVASDDRGNTVRSPTVTTLRRVFYVELKMKTLKTVAQSLAAVRTEMARWGIHLVRLPQAMMDYMPNIGATDVEAFKTKARAAYVGSKAVGKEPYAVAIAFTDQLAVKDSNKAVRRQHVAVGPAAADVDIPVVDGTTTKYLWNDIVPGEGWFVSASFLPDGKVAGTDDIAIPAAACTAVPTSPGSKMLSTVRVNVKALPAGHGTLTVNVNWVNRMRGGISLGTGGNAVCICTRAWWKEKSAAAQNQVAIHELGHTFGMVPDGTGKLPDKTSTHYSGKGHVGDHCHSGLPAATADYHGSTGDCVMFGATNGVNAYCANCGPALRKVDLSAGWKRF